MGYQVVFALKVRCAALEPRVWSEMVRFLLAAFSFPLQMVPSGRRALTSPEESGGSREDSEPGGGGSYITCFRSCISVPSHKRL